VFGKLVDTLHWKIGRQGCGQVGMLTVDGTVNLLQDCLMEYGLSLSVTMAKLM